MHINEGLLQAYLDSEVNKVQKEIIEKHLNECTICKNRLKELRELEEFLYVSFKSYEDEMQKLPLNTNKAYDNFKSRLKNNKWKGMINSVASFKKIVAGLAAIIIFATTVFVPPVREAAANFLHIFRVQKIESIQISIEDLNKMRDDFMNKVGEINLKQLGKANVVSRPKFTKMTLAEAQEKVPFPLKYPNGFSLEQEVQVNGSSEVQFTLNTEQVNKVLKQLGSQKLLPPELNGKTFSIYSQGQVDLHYRLGENNWLSFLQMASPEITVPEGVDVFELRQVLLEIPILPYDLKNKLEAINDWQHTLPIPTDEDSEVVVVNGAQGILRKNKHSSHLIWQKDGVIYNLAGASQMDLVEIANNLRDVK
ncbi:MAG: hypothetical protein PWQ67_372 [Clostridia bacterium]|jgi:hypothetical protein|nr:hypothetical protein [Clostridia bacterium]MDN5321918.1 hypothetical protein [Clostridia bacterium]